MVRWLHPPQLARTAARAVLSGIFGSYADKREMQAALSREAPIVHDYAGEGDIWIDYVADLGDGFDSTYTIAWLLSRDGLDAHVPGDARTTPNVATERGRVLVMGGDQVYPTASRAEYADRLAGPYEAAMPWRDEASRPRLFAIPGNHDWYDGLTSFLRQFTQQRWIGGWQTRQSRSYFAIALPGRWWLLGIDVQLDSDIDKPQQDYFHGVAERMRPGDRVILCTAEPAWVHAADHPEVYDNLVFFERTILCPRGAELALTLTGDLHHYARYTDSTGRRHKITAGGGGAYLYGTHRLPEALELRAATESDPGTGRSADGKTRTWTRTDETVYPSPTASKAMRARAIFCGARNPAFGVFLAFVYALFAWLLDNESAVLPVGAMTGGAGGATGGSFMRFLGGQHLADWLQVVFRFWRIIFHAPFLTAFALLVVAALWSFCTPDPGRSARLKWIGVVHGLAHLMLALGLMWSYARLAAGVDSPWLHTGGFIAWMFVIGAVAGSVLFGAFLLPGVNFNEAFSAQRIEGHKNFVRMRIDADGRLHVHPFGVERAGTWRFMPDAEPGAAYFVPEGDAPEAHLIERPFIIDAPSAGSEAGERERSATGVGT